MSQTLDPNDFRTDHLFLLIGKNPIPNYVAADQLLKPSGQLYLVYSKTTSQTADNLIKYWQKAKAGLILRSLIIPEAGGTEIYRQVTTTVQAILKNPETKDHSIGLHYTGGTKAMSVHAYRAIQDACKQYNHPPVMSYLDANSNVMYIEQGTVSGKTRSLLLSVKPKLEDVIKLHAVELIKDITTAPLYPSLAQKLFYVHRDDRSRNEWREFCGTFPRWWGEKNLSQEKIDDLDRFHFKFPDDVGLSNFITQFHAEVGKDNQPLGQIARQSKFQTSRNLIAWLNGAWLEHYVLDLVKDILTSEKACQIYDCGMNIEPKLGRICKPQANVV